MSQRDFTAARGEAVLIGNIGDPTVHDPSASLENFDEIYDFKDLPIPRRPAWDENTTSEQLDSNEREAFLEWRRKLALIEEGSKMVMTPFEKNLDVWRQL